MAKRGFAEIERRVSAAGAVSHRARYAISNGTRFSRTFSTKAAAEAWLAAERALLDKDEWSPPTERKAEAERKVREASLNTLAAYAERYLAERSLRPNTEHNYRALLRTRILPVLGDLPLKAVTLSVVKEWRAGLDPSAPSANAELPCPRRLTRSPRSWTRCLHGCAC